MSGYRPGPRSPRSRARTGARPSSAAGRGRARERGSENPLLAAAQILLGITLSGLIGFIAFGLVAFLAYLVYSMFK